jgi:hypothetical protein
MGLANLVIFVISFTYCTSKIYLYVSKYVEILTLKFATFEATYLNEIFNFIIYDYYEIVMVQWLKGLIRNLEANSVPL